MNWHLPITSWTIVNALFLGFLAAMLEFQGLKVHNFVEEQKARCFLKHCVNVRQSCFFNPMIALLLICIIPLAQSGRAPRITFSTFRGYNWGSWAYLIISIDAVLVLYGGVLTSFVGVSGLLNRMTLDRIFTY
jgi:hypothetical protein